ncbi:hypothetical protein evm_009291 [Chilo suppressalis]|nr:hypothetical protein evm_009291 [Chilo suppressalis]
MAAADKVVVRAATREDMRTIHRLIHELATYEGAPDGPKLSAQDLVEDGFESNPAWFFALVAELDGEVVGYAMLNRAYSSWTRRALYLEDLYVTPAHRRHGVGMLLLREICKIAVREDIHRIDWHVLEDNPPANAFYARLGARDMRRSEGRAALRLDRPHIERVAAAVDQPASTAPINT